MSRSESSAPAGSVSSPRPASPTSATRWSCATSFPSESPSSRPGASPIYEPGLAELLERNRERLRFTLDPADVFEARRIAFVCVADAADLLGRSRSVGGLERARRAARADGADAPRHEEHGARRDRGEGALPARQPRPRSRRLRLEPRVPGRGHRAGRLHASGPRRRRRVRRGRRRRRRRAVRAPRRAGRAGGRRLGGDGEARLERLSGHEDLLHQRDRERLRGDRRRRRASSRRAWGSTAASARSSCGPASATRARASRRT